MNQKFQPLNGERWASCRNRLTTLLVIAAGAFLSKPAWGALSQESYHLQGVLTNTSVWEGKTNTFSCTIEVFRNGPTLRMIRFQQLEETNYFALGFLSSSDSALNFSQYEPDITGMRRFRKSGNNGSVSLSHYRAPEDVQLAMIWVALAGRDQAGTSLAPVTLFPGYPGFQFHERAKVTPTTESDSGWRAGFSRYSEVVTNEEPGFTQTTTVTVESWTNCAGVVFPQSIAVSHKRTALRTNTEAKSLVQIAMRFHVTQIRELDSPVDVRIPFYSEVTDWQPKEDGRTLTGCNYSITNGMVYDDILKAAEEHHVKYRPAMDWSQSRGLLPGTMAPDFSVETLEGKRIKLSELRGKYIVLTFWSTTCGPCLGQMPQLKETYAAFRENKRFAMIGFALDDDRRKLDSMVKKMGILWPQVQLAEEFGAAISKSYKIKGIPTDYLIGPDGKIITMLYGVEKEYMGSLLSKK